MDRLAFAFVAQIQLGILLSDRTALGAARSDDPVSLVLTRSTLINPPRARGCEQLRKSIRKLHAEAEIIPYAWHYITHEKSDGLNTKGSRTLSDDGSRYGHFRASTLSDRAWEQMKVCIEELDAKRLVFRTPPSFQPSQPNRELLKNFFEDDNRFPAASPASIWEPAGLWTEDELRSLGEQLNLLPMVSGLSATGRPNSNTQNCWLRIDGGKNAKIRAEHAEMLLDRVDGSDCTIIFSGPEAYRNLRQTASAMRFV